MTKAGPAAAADSSTERQGKDGTNSIIGGDSVVVTVWGQLTTVDYTADSRLWQLVGMCITLLLLHHFAVLPREGSQHGHCLCLVSAFDIECLAQQRWRA
jgi:hypothetical protein